MVKNKKVYVVGGATNYARWIEGAELVDNIEEAQVVLFTGGEDVDPSLYGCEKHSTTRSNLARDVQEKEVFEKINPAKQFVIGICRGSQFLCVMNNGKLVQHCTGHVLGYTHRMLFNIPNDPNNTFEVEITSTHHQMMYPWDLPSENWALLAKVKNRLSDEYKGDGINYRKIEYEPEIILFTTPDKPKCLAIQGHPEMMRHEAPVINLLNKLLDTCLADYLLEK